MGWNSETFLCFIFCQLVAYVGKPTCVPCWNVFSNFSEAFLESIPQTHISLVALTQRILYTSYSAERTRATVIFLTSFVISVIGSSYGLTNFLKNGPAKLVEKPGSFLFVFISNATCLVGKAVWLAALLNDSPWSHGPGYENPLYILAWLGLSILPNLILVSQQTWDSFWTNLKKDDSFQQFSVLVYHFGLKSTFSLVSRWPGLVLLPCFSPFAFCGEQNDDKQMLVASKLWSLINIGLTITCAISGLFGLVKVPSFRYPTYLFESPFFICPLLLIASLICTIVIFCAKHCCSPLTQRSGCVIQSDGTVSFIALDALEPLDNFTLKWLSKKLTTLPTARVY